MRRCARHKRCGARACAARATSSNTCIHNTLGVRARVHAAPWSAPSLERQRKRRNALASAHRWALRLLIETLRRAARARLTELGTGNGNPELALRALRCAGDVGERSRLARDGLDDLARLQAARADLDPTRRAIDHRAHALDVRLELAQGVAGDAQADAALLLGQTAARDL